MPKDKFKSNYKTKFIKTKTSTSLLVQRMCDKRVREGNVNKPCKGKWSCHFLRNCGALVGALTHPGTVEVV